MQVPLPGPIKHPRKYLEFYGFKNPVRIHTGTMLLVAVAAIAILFAILLHGISLRGEKLKASDIMIAASALGALIVGYHQWREARRELSMERYYERLDIPNRRLEGHKADGSRTVHDMIKVSLPELTNEDPDALMYVYVELDNLEYVIERYKLGYMKTKQACRGLRTFQLRCWSPQFRRIAHHRVHAGDYHSRTARVVDRVFDEIEKVEKQRYAEVPATAPTEWRPQRRATDRSSAPVRSSGSEASKAG